MNVVLFSVNQFLLFLLVLFRVAGIMFFAPMFGSRAIPRQIKIALSLIIAMVMFTALGPTRVILQDASSPRLGILITMAAEEAVIGVVMGFTGALMFVAFQLAGQIIGRQMGLAMANVLDPVTGSNISILSQLHFFFAMAIFLGMNGHHWFLEGIFATFEMAPVGSVKIGTAFVPYLLGFSAEIFQIAVKLAAPVLAALLLAHAALALLGRTLPQMQVLMIGFPLFIMMGLLLIGFLVPSMAVMLREILFSVGSEIQRVTYHLLAG